MTPKTKRVVCGLSVAAVWLLAIFALPVWVLSVLIMASAGVCMFELSAMLKQKGYLLPFGSLCAAAVVWFGFSYGVHVAGGDAMLLWWKLRFYLLAALCIALFFRVLLDKRIEKPMEVAVLSVAGFVYIPVMLSFFIDIVYRAPTPGAGVFMAFMMVFVTKLCDTGGFFVGSATAQRPGGNHKMCPRLSPGKSWEGTAGGYAFSLAGTAIIGTIAYFFADKLPCLAWVHECVSTLGGAIWLAGTVILAVTVGIFGDLLESLFKRQCGVKDSSALFPAMGGFFDTFDSIIFVPAVFMVSCTVRDVILSLMA